MPPDPYSRSYWRFADEFPDIYGDDATYALWCRLRDQGDMAWPSAATLPYGVKKRALERLVTAELIYPQPGGRFRVRGMDKIRQVRSDSARTAADHRWGNAGRIAVGSADGDASRNAENMPNKRESKRREGKRVPAMPDAEQREHLDRLRDVLADVGALPPKEAAAERQKALPEDEQLIERYTAIAGDESAPDWKRDAAREQLALMGVR